LMCALFAQSAGTVVHQSWAAPDLERPGQWKFLPELKTPTTRPVIDPAQVGTLTLMIKPGQPLPDLRGYPEIRTVKLQGTGISAAQIEQLHAIPHLTGLQVRVFDLPQGALTL